MAQERLHRRYTAAEGDEQLHGFAAAAPGQDVCSSDLAGLGIEDALVLEAREGIRRQHLRPLVTVVAGRIAPGEYVCEAILEAVERRRRHHRYLLAHGLQHLTGAATALGVQLEIEQRKLDLAQDRKSTRLNS